MAKKVKELTPTQQTANSYIDITKIGPLGYRQLQAANADPNSEYEQIMNQGAAQTAALYEDIAPHYTQTPAQLGQSIYDDEVVGGTEYENLNEIRAQRQPWYAKLSAGVAKGAVLAGTTFLDGTVGLAMGIGAAIDKQDASQLWDNPFSRLMQQINEESEKLLPNYYTREEQESPWYENIFTANFLGDKLIKNLGFTVGAFYSGSVYSNLLKMTKIPQLIGTLSRSVQAPKHIISGTGAVLSAINEGRIEALNNSNDWFQYQKQQLDDVYAQKFQALEDAYEGTEMYDSMKMQLQDDYNKSLAKINEDRTKMGNADLLMNLPILTASNIIQFGKLYGNGFKTARKTNGIYGKLGELKTDAAENMTRKSILKGLGVSASEGAEEISQKAASTIAGKAYEQDLNNYYSALSDPESVDKTIDWGKAFGEGLLETLGDAGTWEEGFIGAVTGALGMPMFRGIRNQEGKFQSPITIEGGVRGAFKEISEQARREQEVVDYINNRVQDPKFKDMWKHMVRHQFYDNQMQQAAENNDEFDYKNNETAQLINDIEMFDNAGKLEDLKSLVQEGVNLSDDDINQLVDDTTTQKTADTSALEKQIDELQKEILEISSDSRKRKNTTLEDRKYLKTVLEAKKQRLSQLQEEINNPKQYNVGPFVDEKGNKKSTEEVRQKLKENADQVLKTIDFYTKFKDNLDIRTNEVLTDEQLSTLTYLGTKSDDWRNRNSAMFDGIEPFITNMEGLEGVKDGIELGQRLTKNSSLRENLKTRIDTNVANALDARVLKQFVDDIVKTSNGVLAFNKKLDEYLNNPQKITEQTQRVDQQRTEEQEIKDNQDKQNEIDNLSTFSSVEQHQDTNKVGGEIQNKDLYTNSTNPTVQNFNKAVRFRNEVIEAISNTNPDESTRNFLVDLLNKRFNSTGDYDLLTNPNETAEEEGSGLGEFIQIANSNINGNPSQTQTQVKQDTIPPVTKPETGNDNVGTTPQQPTTPTEVKGLGDLLDTLTLNIKSQTNQDGTIDWFSTKDDGRIIRTGGGLPVSLSQEELEDNGLLGEALDGNVKQVRLKKFRGINAKNQYVYDVNYIGVRDDNTTFNQDATIAVNRPLHTDLQKLKEDTQVTQQLIQSALKPAIPTEAALNTALKTIKNLQLKFNNLSQEKEFNDKAEYFFNKIRETIKNKMYAIDNSNANIDEVAQDNGAESSQQRPQGNNDPKNYLRSDLTEFTIDSFNAGTFENFADKYPNYKTIWDKIVFDYINKGNVKIGDTIELKLEPTESNGKTYETVYMYHNGNIVGVLPSADRTQYTGIQDVYRLLREGKQLSTTVSDIMLGKFPYTRNERRPLHKIKGVNGAANVKLGIMTRAGMVTNDKDLDDNTENVYDLAHSVGKIYILLKNSKGTYSPKRVVVKRFNSQEFPLIKLKDEGNPIAIRLFNMLDQTTKIIIDGIRTNNMDKAYNAMDTLYSTLFKDLVLQGFHMDLMQNPEDGSSYLQFRIGAVRTRNNIAEIHDGQAHFNLNEEELFNVILNQLNKFNPVFNINHRKINNPSYNKEIIESGLLESYISDSQMIGSWFITNYLDANGNEVNASKPKGTFTPPTEYAGKFSFNDSQKNQYTFYVQNDGNIIIMKRSLDKDSKEVNEEVTMDKVPILQRELFKAEYTYGAQMNSPKQINGVVLIEVNGKQYALDRKNQRFLTEEQTKDFIEQLNKKNNPQPKQPQTPQQTQQPKQSLDITITTNKKGQKEAQVKIPKELLGMAKPMGKIKVNDILYPVIIVERPNNGKSSYSVLLPNGQETNFGVNSFNNAEPNLGLKILEFLFSPDNKPELQQAFETAVNSLNQQGTSQDQNREDNIKQTPQYPVTESPQSQTISDDELLDIMNVSVTNIPMPNQQPPQQAQVQNQSNVTVDDDSQNIDLSYDANIELLRLLAVSRETWNSMDSETKKSMLGCQ